MLLVIFGAGASYDSAATYQPGYGDARVIENRPPLADQLFDDREFVRRTLSEFPECLPLITNLRHRTGTATVEQVLDFYLAEAPEYPARHQHLMAIRYFLQGLLRRYVQGWAGIHVGATNYVTLMDHIARCQARYRRVVIATFNYDTMIEDALRTVEVRISGAMSHYIDNERYKLVKVHGSVNWARDIIEPDRLSQDPHVLIREAGRLRFSNEWWLMDGYPISRVVTRNSQSVAAVPAIALPLQTKSQFECPPEHIAVLEESLPYVEKVLVIGWRAMEPHFTSLLKKHLREPEWKIVAGGPAATDIASRLQQQGLPGRFSCSEKGFSGFLIDRESYAFLGA